MMEEKEPRELSRKELLKLWALLTKAKKNMRVPTQDLLKLVQFENELMDYGLGLVLFFDKVREELGDREEKREYRTRKKELDPESTEELLARLLNIREERAASDRLTDEGGTPDRSFIPSSPDERIVKELLKKRLTEIKT